MLWAIAQEEFKLTPRCVSCSLLAGIFGQRLEDTVQYERKYGQRLAPLLVEQCVDFIRERGLTEEGLFRMPGQANLVKDLQDSFDCGEKPLFDRWVDITKFRLVCLWHVKSDRNGLAAAILAYMFFPHHHSLNSKCCWGFLLHGVGSRDLHPAKCLSRGRNCACQSWWGYSSVDVITPCLVQRHATCLLLYRPCQCQRAARASWSAKQGEPGTKCGNKAGRGSDRVQRSPGKSVVTRQGQDQAW